MSKKLTIEEKRRILDKMEEPGMTQVAVAKLLKVSRKTVQNALKQKRLLLQSSLRGSAAKRCHIIVNQKFDVINEAIFCWFSKMREKHGEIPVNEHVICKKAEKLATTMAIPEFKASRGWFRCWKDRYGLSSYKVCARIIFPNSRYVGNVTLCRMITWPNSFRTYRQ